MTTVSEESKTGCSALRLLRSMGPGILMAAAAVGGSHLVASTKAGAIYGWQLIGLIMLVNLFKYPFFRMGVQYTLATGDSLIQGYAHLGKGYLWLYTILNALSAVVNTAALLLFSASLLGYFLPIEIASLPLCAAILVVCVGILLAGHYQALDKLSKFIMIVLTIATVAALVIASINGPVAPNDFQSPSPWTLGALGFIVVTMGWMPAPIEVSSITSMWLKRQCRIQKVTTKSALLDFNVGYIGTALLAVVFIALGALVMHGSGIEFSASGVGFSHQLVNLYASTIGEWSRILIAIIAFLCIFGSTITVIDGYSRAMEESQRLLTNKTENSQKTFQAWVIITSLGAMAILLFFAKALMPMLDFAMIMAFLTTPVFALLNYILVCRTDLPEDLAMTKSMHTLCISGLIYLFGFLLLFVWWKWLM